MTSLFFFYIDENRTQNVTGTNFLRAAITEKTLLRWKTKRLMHDSLDLPSAWSFYWASFNHGLLLLEEVLFKSSLDVCSKLRLFAITKIDDNV